MRCDYSVDPYSHRHQNALVSEETLERESITGLPENTEPVLQNKNRNLSTDRPKIKSLRGVNNLLNCIYVNALIKD